VCLRECERIYLLLALTRQAKKVWGAKGKTMKKKYEK